MDGVLVQAWFSSADPQQLMGQCGLLLDEPHEQLCSEELECLLGCSEDCVEYRYMMDHCRGCMSSCGP